MSDELTNQSNEQATNGQNDLLAELIRSAGRREQPSPVYYDRVFAAAESALAQKRDRARNRRYRLAGLAAGVCAALFAGLLWLNQAPDLKPASQVARIAGLAEWRTDSSSRWTAIETAGFKLPEVVEVRTLQGSGMSLLLGELSLRLAEDTTLTLQSNDEIFLSHGKIYLDSGVSGTAVRVVTPTAIATDVGTQFEVLYTSVTYRLRVREGEVLLATGSNDLSGAAGDEVTIDVNGAVERASVASDDPGWAWAESLALLPVIDGQPLSVLIDWIERETGREVTYANPVLELKTRRTVMHGTIQNLAPMQALEVVLATTDLASEATDDGRILIHAAN